MGYFPHATVAALSTMKALIVFSHPNPGSFNAHILSKVRATLADRGAETRLIDLYDEDFNPVMSREEREGYHTHAENELPVAEHLEDLRWCDTLIFIYPTWWFGLPAMLKGWLDRVFVPHATFTMPTAETPMGGQLHHIKTMAGITTCGARWWQSKVIGEPGRKTILRGIRFLVNPRCKTRYTALYKIDSSTQHDRERYVAKVTSMVARL